MNCFEIIMTIANVGAAIAMAAFARNANRIQKKQHDYNLFDKRMDFYKKFLQLYAGHQEIQPFTHEGEREGGLLYPKIALRIMNIGMLEEFKLLESKEQHLLVINSLEPTYWKTQSDLKMAKFLFSNGDDLYEKLVKWLELLYEDVITAYKKKFFEDLELKKARNDDELRTLHNQRIATLADDAADRYDKYEQALKDNKINLDEIIAKMEKSLKLGV